MKSTQNWNLRKYKVYSIGKRMAFGSYFTQSMLQTNKKGGIRNETRHDKQ